MHVNICGITSLFDAVNMVSGINILKYIYSRVWYIKIIYTLLLDR
jgi:hypothetical protein